MLGAATSRTLRLNINQPTITQTNKILTRNKHHTTPPSSNLYTRLSSPPQKKQNLLSHQTPSHPPPNPRTYLTRTPPSLFEQSEPGSVAFAQCETEAIYDLFHYHAKKSGGVDEDGPYLCERGARELLCSIGERSDDATLKRLFEIGDFNNDGKLHLTEFLTVADKILGDFPARFIFVVGGPGSGKGLLCTRLAAECNVIHISSGDLLRNEASLGTPLGREVATLMAKGDLVPSEIITALLRRRMTAFPGQRVLLDGFPRSTQNAIDFAEMCGKPELALYLDCDDTVMMERVIKRGKESEEEFKVNGGGANGRRVDDNIETALQRIRNYHKAQRPVMDWLADEHVPIVRLDCSGTPENVWDQLMAIGRLMRPSARVPF